MGDANDDSDTAQKLAGKNLLKAASDGDYKAVEKFLKEGISTEVISQESETEGFRPLHHASENGHVRVVKLLLQYQAKRKATARGRTAVHFAANNGHLDVLYILWDAECNINCKTLSGKTPLHLAAHNGHMRTVKWLVAKGSYVNSKTVIGNTAEDFAKEAEHKDIAKFLHEKVEELKTNGTDGGRKLGEGGFGQVFLAMDDNRYYVIKKINLAKLPQKLRESAHQELKLLKSLTHPYIVSYLGGGFKDNHLIIKMEFCSGGDLSSRITEQRNRKVPFEEKLVVNWSLRICLALKFIHSRKILHRDIKPLNIFLTGNGVIKIGDFGVAKILVDASFAESGIGTPPYMSPELWTGSPYNSKADMWAFGCVMFELASLKTAFPFKNLDIPNTFSNHFKAVVTSLLNNDPKRRPDAGDVLRNPIFQEALEVGLEVKEHQVTELNQENEDLGDEIISIRKLALKLQSEFFLLLSFLIIKLPQTSSSASSILNMITKLLPFKIRKT